MTTLEQLAAFVARAGVPSAPLRETLALHVADTVGALIAGRHTPEGTALLEWRNALRAGGGTIEEVRLNVATHCALARLSEIDDIHLGSTTTPGAIVIPAAIAIATAFPGRDRGACAAAIVAGYETMIRLGEALGGAAILQRGIWPSYFTAPAAVAAVAARHLGLDPGQTAHALALALTRSAPGVAHHGAVTTSRWLAIGQAAETGLLAALAARNGFSADVGLLDGTYLPDIYDIKLDPTVVTTWLGQKSVLDEVSFKPWCAARQTMAATQALIEIIESGVRPATIMQVKAYVPPLHRRMVDHNVAGADRSSFLTSLPYRLAVAALAPKDAIALGPVQMPLHVRAFMLRVAVEPDDALLACFPRQWAARVEVTSSSGRHERTVTDVPGDPARPFDAAAVKDKFRRFTAPALGEDAAAALFDRAIGLVVGETPASELLVEIDECSRPPAEPQ